MAASTESDASTRARLAIWIVSLSLLGIAGVSALAIVFARDTDRPEMGRLVFASILPLLGTWVGTVLAFYFARENLTAATESTARLLGLQPSTAVADVMIPKARIISYSVPSGGDAKTVQLVDLYTQMTAAGVTRIPILNDTGAALYVVHKATLDAFAASLAPPKQLPALTELMQDLLGNPDLARRIQAIGFVGPDASIKDARREMSSIADCKDVFVTSNGRKTDQVVGWLTNTDLAATG